MTPENKQVLPGFPIEWRHVVVRYDTGRNPDYERTLSKPAGLTILSDMEDGSYGFMVGNPMVGERGTKTLYQAEYKSQAIMLIVSTLGCLYRSSKPY